MPRAKYDYAWSKLSKLVLARANWRCYKPGCNRRATSTDHIVPVLDWPEGRLMESNCRASCSLHNMGLVMPKLAAMARINRNPQPRRAW